MFEFYREKIQPILPAIFILLFLAFWLRIELRLFKLEFQLDYLDAQYQDTKKKVNVTHSGNIKRNEKNIATMHAKFPKEIREEIIESVEYSND